MGKGYWAVVVRDASTGKGMFVDGANEVTEEVARKAKYGRRVMIELEPVTKERAH